MKNGYVIWKYYALRDAAAVLSQQIAAHRMDRLPASLLEKVGACECECAMNVQRKRVSVAIFGVHCILSQLTSEWNSLVKAIQCLVQ